MTDHSGLNRRLVYAALTVIFLSVAFSHSGELNYHRWTWVDTLVPVGATSGEAGNLTVVVFGVSGTISGATVTIMSGPLGSNIPAPAPTDAYGNVTFTGLIPGSYIYRVDAVGYSSVQNSAIVIAGQSSTSTANLRFQSGEGVQYVIYYILGFGGVLALILFLVRKRILKKKRGTWGEEDYFQSS